MAYVTEQLFRGSVTHGVRENARAQSDLIGYTTGTDRTNEEDKKKRNPKYPGHRTRIEEVTREPMDDGLPSVRWAGIAQG